MSSILKALRRLEEERARKSQVAPEIAANLLRHHSRYRATSPWLWPTLFVSAALILAIVLWQWRPVPVLLPAAAPVSSPVVLSETPPAGKGGEFIIEEVIDRRRPILLPPTTPAAAPNPLSVRVIPPTPGPEGSLTSSPQSSGLPAASSERRQNPVVSAIAWQEDSSVRMAVVDGLPVMTGESVGTARVQEILPDRIVFAEGGALFTVYVSSQ